LSTRSRSPGRRCSTRLQWRGWCSAPRPRLSRSPPTRNSTTTTTVTRTSSSARNTPGPSGRGCFRFADRGASLLETETTADVLGVSSQRSMCRAGARSPSLNVKALLVPLAHGDVVPTAPFIPKRIMIEFCWNVEPHTGPLCGVVWPPFG